MHVFLLFDPILTMSLINRTSLYKAYALKVFSEAKESGEPRSLGGNAI